MEPTEAKELELGAAVWVWIVRFGKGRWWPGTVEEIRVAAGLPIVATHVGGIPELIEHERTGLLIAPGDAPALAGCLLRLMAEPATGSRLGRAARQAVEARYSFRHMVSAFDSLYATALAGQGVAVRDRTPREVLAR